MSKEKELIDVKLTKRILVKGEGQKVGTKIKVSKNEGLRLVNAGKATFDLKKKTATDPTDEKSEKDK